MSIPSIVTCPHCGAANPEGASFCESCGKALPSAIPSGPRVVSADAMTASAVAQRLVGDELVKQQRKASLALLLVGILQLTCGAILVTVLVRIPASGPSRSAMVHVGAQFGVGAIFLGLYFWARRSPLPATIVGFCLYCTLVALNVVASVSNLGQEGTRGTGLGGLGIGWLDIVVVVILAQAVSAGMKHKRLMEQQAVAE